MEKKLHLIDKHRAAEMLSISTRSLFKLREKKLIKSYRILNAVKYCEEDIYQYINSRKIQ